MYKEISRDSAFDILKEISDVSPSRRIDIGSGGHVDHWTTIDKSGKGEGFHGDIRTLFAPVYNEKIDGNLKKISYNTFSLVKMQHIVEHVEWIHQQSMLSWVYRLLSFGGTLFIETPNVDWVIDSYLSSNDYSNEHPDIKEDDPCRFIKWLNFKLYSGCSTNKYKEGCTDGDYHLCMYNAMLLYGNLTDAGFNNISINEGETLVCLAKK